MLTATIQWLNSNKRRIGIHTVQRVHSIILAKLLAGTCLLHCCLFIFRRSTRQGCEPASLISGIRDMSCHCDMVPPSNNYFIIPEKPPDNLFRITDTGKWRLPWILKTVLRHWMETSVWKDGTFFSLYFGKNLIKSDPLKLWSHSFQNRVSPNTGFSKNTDLGQLRKLLVRWKSPKVSLS